MRTLLCVLYNLCTVVYFVQSYDTVWWFGFKIFVDVVSFALYIIVSRSRKRATPIDDLYLNYTIGALIVRGVYTEICVFQPKGWVHDNTTVFAILYAVSFGILAIYSIYLYYKI